ncbi:LysM peptidoglycan-binding domain-containing protein [Paenibacillus glufosinatiresistens]|uniref:LysM peptidoglycan-binding domain-containing protein n=1 Tax=Paenibacillus glufosinatiresistens TaxID=3070657 RepID=UPI00286E0D8E|nr:LysM peptidoglycan-binding domain-containing protein [Paenibacillus sp. YX.27]
MLKYSTYRSIYEEKPAAPSELHRGIVDYTSGTLTVSRRLFTRENLISLMIVLLLTVSGFTVVGSVFANSVSSLAPEKRIVVSYGDTLWEIAREHKPEAMRTVVYVEAIKDLNGLEDGSIQAGDILSLPRME